MTQPTRKRLLGTPPNMHPRAVVGKELFLLDMKRYLRREHRNGGWGGEKIAEVQAEEGFRFDGKDFRRYTRKVLGKDLERLYFPAAYVGKVADALRQEGYDVFATDLGDEWVAHLRSLGLRAEKRSFEDIPKEKFDAIVCFEPYCIPDPIAYLAILRMMADSIPCFDISLILHAHNEVLSADQQQNLAQRSILRDTHHVLDEDERIISVNRSYPITLVNFDRIAYDYGARFSMHRVYAMEHIFKFKTIMPTPESSARAVLDLRVMKKLDVEGGRVSVNALANALRRPVNEVAASLKRLMDVFNRRLAIRTAVEKRVPKLINSSKKLSEEEMRDLVRRITFVE